MELNSRLKKSTKDGMCHRKHTHSHMHTPECGITVIEVIGHRELSYTAVKQK